MYKKMIYKMLEKIENEDLLIKIYTFISEWMKGGAQHE